MMEAKNIKDKFISFCTSSEELSKCIIHTLFGWLVLILSVVSLFSTAYYALDYNEHPLYENDNPFLLIGVITVLVILFCFFDKKIGIDRINTRILICVLMVYTAAIAFLWLYYTKTVAVADQGIVRDMAKEFHVGEYSALDKGHYLYIYPFQLGITAFIELSYTIFGKDSLMLLYIFNVLSPCLAFYSLYRITDLSFHNKKINNLVIFLMFGCFPPIMYCTFVYGNIMGLGFSLAAVWMQLKYFESGKIRYFVISAISIAFAIIIRSNSSIVLVAMVIMFLLKFLNTRKARNLALPLVAVAVTLSSSALLNAYYESRSGREISDGAPKILWFAMGLQDSDRAPGWYNGFSHFPYADNDCDPEIATEMAKEAIKESLKKFKDNPQYAIEFFSDKFASQWNEPTFQSFWISTYHVEDAELSDVITSLYTGNLHSIAVGYMNIYHFIIAFGAMFFFILQSKIKSEQLFLGLIVFGGFLFHMLWEAKGQYIMTYFTMLLPYAGVGIYNIIEFIKEKIDKKSKKLPT
jgi:hypothetical protein